MSGPRGIFAGVLLAGCVGVALGFAAVRGLSVDASGSGARFDALVQQLARTADRALASGERAEFSDWARSLVAAVDDVERLRLLAERGAVVVAIPAGSDVVAAAEDRDIHRIPLRAGGSLEVTLRAPGLLGPWALPIGIGGIAAIGMILLAVRRRVVDPLEELRHRVPALGKTGNDKVVLPHACTEVQGIADELAVAASRIVDQDRISKQSLVEMENAFDRIHAVFRSIDEGVIVVDRDGRFVFANPSAYDVLQLPPRDSYEDIAWPEALRLRIERAKRSAHESKATSTLRDIEIGGRVFDVSVTPLRREKHESGGSSPGVAFVLVDRSRARELARMKDDFLSSVSHELRTPLTSIRSFTEILIQLAPEDHANRNEFLDIINRESERLMRLVNEVLDLASIESGRADLEIESCSLETIVENVVNVCQPAAKDGNVHIETDLEIGLPMLLTARDRAHQVLLNLVGNALKFTPDDGRVHIRARRSGVVVEITVEDSGPGVPEDEREAIFHKFHQGGGDTLTSKPSGTGLGLSICQELVELLGGEITCERSAELGGACFRFTLAAVRENEPSFGSVPAIAAARG